MAGHGDHRVRHGWGAYWGVSAAIRLFTRGAKIWGEGRVHPGIELSGERRWLSERMDHLVDRDISNMFDEMNHLAILDAVWWALNNVAKT